ncbi:MAG: Formamidopyrimidine-DNA glycosylase [Fimbriimonadaceae bacterium]|nr:Formamidopyrimidine-DNA glycosylase [Fimbriimonadaceae bacterium]
MPELPDLSVYVEQLERRVLGQPLKSFRTLTPFVLRTVEPAPSEFVGKKVVAIRLLGKRIVIGFEAELAVVIHLMIAGRLRWLAPGKGMFKPGGKIGLATWEFDAGTLVLTEVAPKKRAGIWLVRGEEDLRSHDPGGIDPLSCSEEQFVQILSEENRTLKRAITQPQRMAGIGNAYSDEILFHAKLSPLRLTRSLSEEEWKRLHEATQSTLRHWIDKLRDEFGEKFPGPGEVTAFRPDFAVHGRFGQPCIACGKPVQRIRYADNETNYCAICQNEGRLLADRSLSRLLKDDWPRTLEDLEEGRA